MNIAIDGPAGAGKSTVAKMVAGKLDYLYIDTGSMYRALAWAVLDQGLPIEDESVVSKLLKENDIRLRRVQGEQHVYWNNTDVTEWIRTPNVSQYASVVASYASVREQMLILQRNLAVQGKVVMDGRDIGTHVLPDAEVKIFLTASIQERAMRRWKELRDKGFDPNLAEMEQEIAERDQRDMNREVAPLRQAEDAILVDTTGMTIAQVAERILEICERVGESSQ
ncbi:cytidylate kinase [Brevibacillus panacihumi W25]|uniref:Cytidylate kinase n=1 Tax=Brevibacillus panacihumi W25 TaxID=1408254 RepID=V6MC40_9BACL|nr:(d)CMP kinase [Brevibacillus panacihumi]EST56079.1 cytidylate kinase [Brevibacillus panacihumi W25]